MNLIKNFLIRKMNSAFEDSYRQINKEIIAHLKGKKSRIKILDIGCADFVATKQYLKNVDNYELHAFDHFDSVNDKSVVYQKVDLETEKFPVKDNLFDVVIAGQVIEHILNKDRFLEECYRVLKKGGLFVCATENIASFDNIVSLLFGQEPLSQQTGSKFVTNSCLSPHFMTNVTNPDGNRYNHKNVCSYYGLQRLFKVNGFKKYRIISMGNIGKIFEKIFKIYNRIIVVFGVK